MRQRSRSSFNTCRRGSACGLICITAVISFLAIPVFSQEPNLRIYGIGFGGGITFGDGPRRPEGSELIELPVTMSDDGRYARFRLMVSVRNYGVAAARYKLLVQLEGRGRAAHSPIFEVAKGAVRREAYDVELDFAYESRSGAGTGGGLASPTPVIVLPNNPVLANLFLLDPKGNGLERKPFNLILRSAPRRAPRRADLTVEEPRLVYTPERRRRGEVVSSRHVEAHARIRNVGSEIWGFQGDVYFHLQSGTPETDLDDLGERGMPTLRSLPLPAGLASGASSAVSTALQTRCGLTSQSAVTQS